MASVSATFLSFKSSTKQSVGITNVLSRTSSPQSVSFGCTKGPFTTSRTLRFHISCSAKPETVQQVCDIVKKQLALPADQALTPESKFSALGADSLDTVEIVMGLEEAFDISIEEENSQNITTIQEAADLIEKIVGQRSA